MEIWPINFGQLAGFALNTFAWFVSWTKFLSKQTRFCLLLEQLKFSSQLTRPAQWANVQLFGSHKQFFLRLSTYKWRVNIVTVPAVWARVYHVKFSLWRRKLWRSSRRILHRKKTTYDRRVAYGRIYLSHNLTGLNAWRTSRDCSTLYWRRAKCR